MFLFQKTAAPCKTIGICALEHGSGTTCISLALSHFLCNKMRKKTAYIELNTSNQISSLSGKRQKTTFLFMGITFFPNVTLARLPEILQKRFDYFVLDMGILNTNTAYEFSRCQKQFLVGSMSLWKQEKTVKNLEQLQKITNMNQEHMVFLGNPMIKESLCSGRFKAFSKVISVPFIENPFQIASKDFSFFESLLERNKYTT